MAVFILGASSTLACGSYDAGRPGDAAGGFGSAGESGNSAGIAGAATAPGGAASSGGRRGSPGATSGLPLTEALEVVTDYDAADLMAAYPVQLGSTLGYDPKSAAGLEVIQGSSLALTSRELDKLGQNGFVISATRNFPTFGYGYKSIYLHDLPVYISADSILFAVHKAYDALLTLIERTSLTVELDAMLEGMRDRLAARGFEPTLGADLDLYLTVAHSLLRESVQPPKAGADPAEVQALYGRAMVAEGTGSLTLFGTARDEDFSQFKPRGHYTQSVALQRYFRAMMMLGRVDFRMLETQSDGSQKFHRRQFDAALALRELLDEAGAARWAYIDRVVGAFLGERDAMALPDVDGLLGALGVDDVESARALDDAQIQGAIAGGTWGEQRIASRIIIKGMVGGAPLPRDRSFALFGQRYTVDSHVFSNTTYDRVDARMMPSPLDVAFAALGNDAALEHLAPELSINASYAGGLARSRVLVDAHEPAYWEGSLYTTWLAALRALSPTAATLSQLPSVAKTRAFQTRVLNTQLASWAELRHDTLLYAKQSYTTGAACEFPDAYVDPYPEFYARLREFARRVRELVAALPAPTAADAVEDPVFANVGDWVDTFETVMGYLERMATNQRSGMPHGQELLDFVNQAVSWNEGRNCDGTAIISEMKGWYPRLFLSEAHATEFAPTIADVHTQPTDWSGAEVGRVLHVGTGYARSMVVTVETCEGPRAYVGLASSYGEVIEDKYERLDDDQWSGRVVDGIFPDVPWMVPVQVH